MAQKRKGKSKPQKGGNLRFVSLAIREGKSFYYVFDADKGIAEGIFVMKQGSTKIAFKLSTQEYLILRELLFRIIDETKLSYEIEG